MTCLDSGEGVYNGLQWLSNIIKRGEPMQAKDPDEVLADK